MASSVDVEYTFVTEPEDTLKCLICHEVARDPFQHEECGKLYCKQCLEKYGRSKPCPNCRMGSQYYKDNKSRRDIAALAVKCANMERGCEWKGTVGSVEKHLITCKFSLVPCPKECKDASNVVQHFRKKDLKEHLKKDCPNRPGQCQHCGEKGTHAEIQLHDETCPKKKVTCKNCNSSIPRKDIGRHVSTYCPLTEIPCKFASIGCEVKRTRKEMASHEGNDSLHLHMALNTIVELKNSSTRSFQNDQALKEDESITFSVSEYQKRKESDQTFQTPSFYTSPRGYHMAFRVSVNGAGSARGTHVSVSAPILEGIYDSRIKWPFVGHVTITLLNQIEDRNHHTKTLYLTAEDNALVANRIWGYHKFISHSALAHDPVMNTQYLKDDTLYFGVSVKVADHKPWLQCRIARGATAEVRERHLKHNKPKTFALFEYRKKKEADDIVILPSFYTSPINGYHMAVRVDANGDGDGKGTHVSVYALILRGKYDSRLNWPFVGKVAVVLLNQLKDQDHHNDAIFFTVQSNKHAIQDPYGKGGIGKPHFIPHSALEYDPEMYTQYLRDDTLYFRVSVEVANHKPWLE